MLKELLLKKCTVDPLIFDSGQGCYELRYVVAFSLTLTELARLQVILDEPDGAIDSDLRKWLEKALKRAELDPEQQIRKAGQ